MSDDFPSDVEMKIRQESAEETLADHEARITENERFRLRMQGAIAVIGFALGGGVVTTVLLYGLGVV